MGAGRSRFQREPSFTKTFRDVQLVHVERRAGILGLALGVGNGAAQHLFHVARRALLGEAQNLQGVLGALAANQVHHQAHLLRRHAHMPRQRVRLNGRRVQECSLAIRYAFGAPARRLRRRRRPVAGAPGVPARPELRPRPRPSRGPLSPRAP